MMGKCAAFINITTKHFVTFQKKVETIHLVEKTSQVRLVAAYQLMSLNPRRFKMQERTQTISRDDLNPSQHQVSQEQ